MKNLNDYRLETMSLMLQELFKYRNKFSLVLKKIKWDVEIPDKFKSQDILTLIITDETFDHCFYNDETDDFTLSIMFGDIMANAYITAYDIVALLDENEKPIIINEFILTLEADKKEPENSIKERDMIPYTLNEIMTDIGENEKEKESFNKFLKNNPALRKRFGIEQV